MHESDDMLTPITYDYVHYSILQNILGFIFMLFFIFVVELCYQRSFDILIAKHVNSAAFFLPLVKMDIPEK